MKQVQEPASRRPRPAFTVSQRDGGVIRSAFGGDQPVSTPNGQVARLRAAGTAVLDAVHPSALRCIHFLAA